MKINYKFWKLLFISALSILFVTTTALAQRKTTVKHIKFAKGQSSVVVKGSMNENDYVDYRFYAKKGQTATIRMTSSDRKAKFQVGAVQGEGPYENADMVADWKGELPANGTHLVIIYAYSKRISYTLKVTIQ
jgi:maltose-binding protein MalE